MIYRDMREALMAQTGQSVRIVDTQSHDWLLSLDLPGVLARLYLSPKPFLDRTYRGLDYVDHLITLGSPHYNRGGLNRGGRMSRWVERCCPGAAFSPQVQYTCVAGRLVCGSRSGSVRERWMYNVYLDLCGEGTACGDGLVPVNSALLSGARTIILDGVSHFKVFGEPWYGSEKVIPLWRSGD
jgi:hypothetical protein